MSAIGLHAVSRNGAGTRVRGWIRTRRGEGRLIALRANHQQKVALADYTDRRASRDHGFSLAMLCVFLLASRVAQILIANDENGCFLRHVVCKIWR